MPPFFPGPNANDDNAALEILSVTTPAGEQANWEDKKTGNSEIQKRDLEVYCRHLLMDAYGTLKDIQQR